MNGKAHARPASFGEYQAWLESIGMYVSSNDWNKNVHRYSHDSLFRYLYTASDLAEGKLISIKTDNPRIGASIDDFFDGSIVDLLNIQIMNIKKGEW